MTFETEESMEQYMEEEEEPAFHLDALNDYFKVVRSNASSRIHKDALRLLAAYLKVFVQEAVGRAYQIAKVEQRQYLGNQVAHQVTIDIDHLRKILHQLLLDF